MLDIYVRDRQRDYINCTLLSSGSAIDLSSYNHVSLVIKDNRGSVTEYSSADGSPIIYISDASNGIMQLRPSANLLLSTRSPYFCFWKGYIDATRWYAIPDSEPYFRILVQDSWS